MLRNTAISVSPFFYALGNTPAVNLTQDLPPELERVNVLLAGCGDARNILFTLSQDHDDKRSLDFTCCDIDPAILARNILLFSLLLDSKHELDKEAIWDIYFHVAIRESSRKLLEAQVDKLIKHATSMQEWKGSSYAKVIKFADSQTLQRVRDTWSAWSTEGLSEAEKKTRQKELTAALDRAKRTKKTFVGSGITMSGIRSAAPVGILALRDLTELFDFFWAKGNLDAKATNLIPNPTFLLNTDRASTVHYGTNPLLGFHLATAYTALKSSSPLKAGPDLPNHLPGVVRAAQTEFFTWAEKFKASANARLVVRCFAGDALAFGHTLQHIQTHPTGTTGGWHRDGWSFVVLDLEEGGYRSARRPAPTTFDIIDTSNLVDHLGSLNIIIAFAPLLSKALTSTLYTEILVSSKAGPEERMKDLLCGDFASVCLLTGLANVEAWTNTSATSDVDEGMVDTIVKQINMGSTGDSTQLRTRVCWKWIDEISARKVSLSMDPSDLAAMMMTIHNNMFRHEDISTLMRDLDKHGVDQISNAYYNRASFASLLKYVRFHVQTDWTVFIDKLFDQIHHNARSALGFNTYQDLCLSLHLQGVHSVSALLNTPMDQVEANPPDRLKWPGLPRVLAITVQIPGDKIKYVGDVPVAKLGIPLLCCTVENYASRPRPWSNLFGSVQAGFGTVEATNLDAGTIADQLRVLELKSDWSGKTPLVVSFYVPTWILLSDRSGTTITVGFQTTPGAAGLHAWKLGPRLALYSTALTNHNNVYISRYMPGMNHFPSICAMQNVEVTKPTPSKPDSNVQIILNSDSSRIDRLTRRLDITGSHQADLANKATAVVITQVSPFVIALKIGQQPPLEITYPRPVSSLRSKLRVARKSSYVEVVAPFMSPLDPDFPQDYTFPMSMIHRSRLGPVSWHMPYVNISTLPRLDLGAHVRMGWLNTHTSLMFSTQERIAREAGMDALRVGAMPARPRVDFKDGLLSIFGHTAGVGHPGIKQTAAFGLNKKDAGGVHTLIFVSEMLLDLANHTTVLDAAVIPLTHNVVSKPVFQKVMSTLQAGKLCLINVSDEELRIWKRMLPAFAERCRTWKHNEDHCEYVASGQVPLPGGLEDAATPLCSCGRGRVPKNFASSQDVPQLDLLLRTHATRIAISPIFAVPYVEPCFSIGPRAASSSPSTANTPPWTTPGTIYDGCAMCGRKQAKEKDVRGEAKPLLKCAQCRQVRYCSSECQKQHWKAGHKVACVKT